MMALVCLQAQQVSGLPAAAEGRQIQLHLQHHQQEHSEEAAAASARCRAGVAAFHDQVLLLHCTPVDSVTSVAVRVSSSSSSCLVHHHPHHHQVHEIDLAAQLHRPSPSVLSFDVLHAGAVLTLTLHHRLIRRRRRSSCLPRPMIPDCLRTRTDHHPKEKDDDGDQSSSGFITIDKGTISRRRPPSDNLLTTDDSGGEVDDKPMALLPDEELEEVENEFLAKLHGRDVDLLDKKTDSVA